MTNRFSWHTATKKQLYCIATDDAVPLDLRYEAARELQVRRFDSDMLLDLVRMWPTHNVYQIAKHLGLSAFTVAKVAKRYGLLRTRRRKA